MASKITQEAFGTLPSGEAVTAYTLTNASGAGLTVIDYGAIIKSIKMPVRGETIDVVLGFDNAESYVESRGLPAPPYFGAVAGRYAGRIKNGRFRIDSKEYELNRNNGNNTLHGGIRGFDAVLWQATKPEIAEQSLTMSYTSAAGEERFPGELNVSVTYTLTANNEVIIEYTARTTEDTIVNLTQHSYFNLEGHTGSVAGQLLKMNAAHLLEIEADNIPTGNIIAAAQKGFDFTQEKNCPDRIDDSFVIEDHSLPAAILRSKKTGLSLTVFTDQPSVHIYVGGNCDGLKGKNGANYHAHSGICFETQNFPDAPNQPGFPNAVLRKGETYTQRTTWKFSVD